MKYDFIDLFFFKFNVKRMWQVCIFLDGTDYLMSMKQYQFWSLFMSVKYCKPFNYCRLMQ